MSTTYDPPAAPPVAPEPAPGEAPATGLGAPPPEFPGYAPPSGYDVRAQAAPYQAHRSADAALSPAKIRLGEELPVFCERCGYALHGLPQAVCTQCAIRHFRCPECGHTQPINTLRPAFQKILGRLRALSLVLLVIFKINFFGWLLFAWVAMGVEWAYMYNRDYLYAGGPAMVAPGARPAPRPPVARSKMWVPRTVDTEELVAFGLFAFSFAAVGRMLLLRWRRGYAIGGVLAALVIGAVAVGAVWHRWMRGLDESPFTTGFFGILLYTGVIVLIGASSVWGIWMALVHVFLPKRAGAALLDWQRNLSNRESALARE